MMAGWLFKTIRIISTEIFFITVRSQFYNSVSRWLPVVVFLNLNNEIVENVIINCPKSVGEQTRIAIILYDMDVEIQALETKLEKYRK